MAETEPEYALDDVDRRIVTELSRDGRMSMRALAEATHISRAHAYVRVDRLIDAGVIEGFTARIAYEKAGVGASAYVALSIRQDSWRAVADELSTLAFVEHVSLMGGDFDALVLVRAPNTSALRHLVLDELQGLDGIVSTRTWLIFDEAVGPGAQWYTEKTNGRKS